MKNDDVEDVPCDLCGSLERHVLFRAADTIYQVPGQFSVNRCDRCGLVYVSPRPTENALSRWYPDAYQPHAAPDSPSKLAVRARKAIFLGNGALHRAGAWFYNRLSFRLFVTARAPGRLLDVGCGAGTYLRAWQQLGWAVEGLEPVAAAAAEARRRTGAPIIEGAVEDAMLPETAYDVITMSHSLEHARSPKRALTSLYKSLRPGGRILIMVPNFAAWERLFFGSNWLALEVPRHLYHFEPRTLRATLSAAGFSDIEIGGTVSSGTMVRHLRQMLGLAPTTAAPASVRALLLLTNFPAALAVRAKGMWAIACKPA